MTRSTRIAHAVTALTEARAADSALTAQTMTFRVFEDNGGGYHWTIVDNGETLVRSASFASYEAAERAARIVRDGASSASFDERSASVATSAETACRDDATSQDRSDAERWLDEVGGFAIEAATR